MKTHMPVDTVMPLLEGVPGVRSGISRRPVDASDRVAGRAWAARAAGVEPRRVGLLRQVHGSKVWTAPWKGFPAPVEGDALLTTEAGLALAVLVADCTPVVMAVEDGRAVAMVHAGWRGVRDGIVASAVETLCREAGCGPEVLKAALGPTIGLCCYEVGMEFGEYFHASLLHRQDDRLFLDLPGVVAVALEEAGLEPASIDVGTAICTVCGRGAPAGIELHSHRRSAGGAGRNIAFVVKERPA